jgi:hypothetical protein
MGRAGSNCAARTFNERDSASRFSVFTFIFHFLYVMPNYVFVSAKLNPLKR